MPLYDYRCTECDREVEVMHGIHDSGPERCQTCGGAMRKAFSPPTIHFKGSGWAKKDAAAATAKKAKPKGTTSAEATKSDGETKSSSTEKGTTEKASSAKSESGSSAASTAASKTE